MNHLLSKLQSGSKAARRFARRIVKRFIKPLRHCYRKLRQKELTNRDFTIISNNCCAGVIYHDPGQRFDTPTINIWIPNEYFFEFLHHLDHYIHTAPEQISMEGIPYPVGRIRRDSSEIILHFMHDKSFSAACEKWLERGKRVSWDNLYVIFNTTDPGYIEKFSELDFRHKVMLTHFEDTFSAPEDVRDMPVYHRSMVPGVILEYKSSFALRRWLDDFDYISFLNET